METNTAYRSSIVNFGWGNNGDTSKGNNERQPAQFQFYANSITSIGFVNITFVNGNTGNFIERFFYGYPTYAMIINSRFDLGYNNDFGVSGSDQTFVKNSVFTQSGWFPSPTAAGKFFGLGGYVGR